MTNPKHISSAFLLILLSYTCIVSSTCTDSKDNKKVAPTEVANAKQSTVSDTLERQLLNNIYFLGDSLLNGKSHIIKHYIGKYQPDSCGTVTYATTDLKSNFEGTSAVQDINGNNVADTVFVVPNFNYCDDGQSYTFFDTTLPRLYTDSYCCHPDNFFTVSDIDEDGTLEVGIYYSSCASRYKSLRIYSLKNNQWKEIATSTFDVMTKDPSEVKFSSLVKKLRKNEFMVCSFNDGKTIWEKVKM